MKKIFKLFMIAMLLIPCMLGLAGCGSGGSNSNNSLGGGNGSGASGSGENNVSITSVFSGYTLPTNCKLIWTDEPSDLETTVVKIGDECTYSVKNLESDYVFSTIYYKKISTGYTVYTDYGLGFQVDSTYTNQEAYDEFELSISNSFFAPAGLQTNIIVPTNETVTIGANSFPTKFYDASTGQYTIHYWLHRQYNLVCQLFKDGYNMEFVDGYLKLTFMDTTITSFGDAGINVPQ